MVCYLNAVEHTLPYFKSYGLLGTVKLSLISDSGICIDCESKDIVLLYVGRMERVSFEIKDLAGAILHSAAHWCAIDGHLDSNGTGGDVACAPHGESFFAGMLTTCGISNAGPECRDDIGILSDVPFGLHGDISNTGADNVCTYEEWVGGEYVMRVSGRMEEGRLHGEHMQLRRTVTAKLGEKKLCIEDEFTNVGELPQMLMFFYHINLGHPVLGEGARFVAPSKRIWAETEHAKAGFDIYDKCTLPKPGYLEQQFFHEMGADADGNTICALINDELELAVYLKYNVRELPCIAQWKVLRDAEYVLAFEPGNCHPIGRIAQKAKGEEEILEPMQSRFSHLEIGVADGAEEIAALEKEIADRR